jgi:acyl-CoA thioesterase
MPLHVFDEALQLAPLGDGAWQGHTHTAWWNMVGPFGGITAATALRAIELHPQVLGAPVALTVNYVAAVASGPYTVTSRVVRTNRSSQHWLIEITQPDASGAHATVLTGTALTALRRETFAATDCAMPDVPKPDALRTAPPPRELEFLARYDTRIVTGAPPAQWDAAVQQAPADQLGLTQLWTRLTPARALDYVALAACADIFYPRVWLRRATRVPAGTVSMTVYFHADAHDLAATGDGFVLCQARAQAYRNGHADQTAQLWNEAGTLLATSHQIVYYKE